MNSTRIWILAAVAAMVVIALGGYFIGVSPVIAQAAASDEQVASVTQANRDSAQKLALLKQQYAHIGPLRKTLDSLRRSIPEVADASAFLQEIDDLSAAAGVNVTSVTIASSTIYKAPAAASASGTTTTTTGSTPTPTPTPPATAPAVAPAAPTALFVQIPVSIVVSGDFDAVRNFVGAIQKGKRLYLMTAFAVTQSGTSTGGAGSSTGTLTGDIFTLQGTSDDPTAKKQVSPNPVATPTPTPTGTPTPGLTPTPSPTPTPTPTP